MKNPGFNLENPLKMTAADMTHKKPIYYIYTWNWMVIVLTPSLNLFRADYAYQVINHEAVYEKSKPYVNI